MIVTFHPDASAELRDAAAFYSAQSNPALGLAFIVEVERVVAILSGNPQLGKKTAAGAREMGTQRFPFRVVYKTKPGHLFIMAIAHEKRRSGYWRRRII